VRPPGDAQLVEAASGTTFTLSAEESHVGRIDRSTGLTPEVDLTKLDTDRTIGRRHAKIVRRGGAYFVQDASSRNGTFVNNQRIAAGTDIELRDGDEVRFGLVKTTFRWR
jgi:pSer/pThr/pTyr-binding forkhead associated (FHA) protein